MQTYLQAKWQTVPTSTILPVHDARHSQRHGHSGCHRLHANHRLALRNGSHHRDRSGRQRGTELRRVRHAQHRGQHDHGQWLAGATGTGTLILSGTGSTFSGGTTLPVGLTQVSNAGLGTGLANFVSSGSTLQAAGNISFGGLSINHGLTATLDTNGNSMTLTGNNTTGDANTTINKIGLGTATFTGTNANFHGNTIITAGVVTAARWAVWATARLPWPAAPSSRRRLWYRAWWRSFTPGARVTTGMPAAWAWAQALSAPTRESRTSSPPALITPASPVRCSTPPPPLPTAKPISPSPTRAAPTCAFANLGYLGGPTGNPGSQPGGQSNNYTATFTGYIYLTGGVASNFTTASDDGSMLFISTNGGQSYTPVVDNDNFQGLAKRSGSITVPTSGYYPMEIAYFQGNGQNGLDVYTDLSGTNVLQNSQVFNGASSLSYSNALSVTANSTIDLPTATACTYNFPALSIGGNTLGITSGLAGAKVAITGTTTIASSANSTFNVAAPNTLILNPISGDNTTSITLAGSGTLAGRRQHRLLFRQCHRQHRRHAPA